MAAAALFATVEARTARAEALKAESVNKVLSGMLSTFGDYGFDPQKYTVAEMLAAAERDLGKGPKKDPLVEATVRRSLADGYTGLSRFADAKRQIDRAIPILEKLGDKMELAAALSVQARIDQNDGNLEAMVLHLNQSLDLLMRLGPEAPAEAIFDAKLTLAQALSPQAGLNRDLARARRLTEEAIELARRDASISRVGLALALSEMGSILAEEQKPVEAEKVLLEALATGRGEDPGGTWELNPLFTLHGIRDRAGDLAGSEAYASQEVQVMAHRVGPNHLMTAVARIQWASLAARNHEIQPAVEAVDQAMPIVMKDAAPASPNRWIAARDSSLVMRLAGRLSDAEHYARLALSAAQAQHLSDSDARLANSWEQLGYALAAEKKIAESTQCLKEAQSIYARAGAGWVATREAVGRRLAEIEKPSNPK